MRALLPLHHGPELCSRSGINVAVGEPLSKAVQLDSMDVIQLADQLSQLESGEAWWHVMAV